ncbi:uncharacterized protein LOC143360093 [Halictus rubicundus]|uniref:uncharacterized protein LOC143360093 n=1 Tax=Halictus rubicundus TaxID=77578 RepID=UPI004035F23B
MTEFQHLEDAIEKLNKSISNFCVGADSLDDYKPVEDRIKNMRDSLTQLSAKLIMLKAHTKFLKTKDMTGEVKADTVTKLHEATSESLLNNKAIKLCLHSYAIQRILKGEEGDQDKQIKIDACFRKLFNVNDEMLTIQKDIDETVQKQLDLKIECQNMLYQHRKFLDEQTEIRNKKLEETNSEVARNKKNVMKRLDKINIMKKLIVNMIGASSHLLMQEPMLVKMLEKHKDLISIDTISKMAQDSAEN